MALATDPTLFYAFRSGPNFWVEELTASEASKWPQNNRWIEPSQLNASDAFALIQSVSLPIQIKYKAVCPKRTHLYAACYWQSGPTELHPQQCPKCREPLVGQEIIGTQT